jgi:hypothetical protein
LGSEGGSRGACLIYGAGGGTARRGGGLGQLQAAVRGRRRAVGGAGRHRAYRWGAGRAVPAHVPRMRPRHSLLLRAGPCLSRAKIPGLVLGSRARAACPYIPLIQYRVTSPSQASNVAMKTDRIRMDIANIIFVFIFLSGFGFEYG